MFKSHPALCPKIEIDLVQIVSTKENGLLKDVELKLISELMKNSRRSDRVLAKAIESLSLQ